MDNSASHGNIKKVIDSVSLIYFKWKTHIKTSRVHLPTNTNLGFKLNKITRPFKTKWKANIAENGHNFMGYICSRKWSQFHGSDKNDVGKSHLKYILSWRRHYNNNTCFSVTLVTREWLDDFCPCGRMPWWRKRSPWPVAILYPTDTSLPSDLVEGPCNKTTPWKIINNVACSRLLAATIYMDHVRVLKPVRASVAA